MGTVIKAKLTPQSLKKAAKQVRKYADNLKKTNEQFVQMLAEIGYDKADVRIMKSPVGKYCHIEVKKEQVPYGAKAILIATGSDLVSASGDTINAMLITEFGTGIRFNDPGNPLAPMFGMGAGSYGYGLGSNPEGWSYIDTDRKRKHTYGIKATMPMYEADMKILLAIEEVAKKVFKTTKVITC